MTKSGKHFDKSRNCSFWAISSFVTMFSKSRLLRRRQKAFIWEKWLTLSHSDISVADDFWKQCCKNRTQENRHYATFKVKYNCTFVKEYLADGRTDDDDDDELWVITIAHPAHRYCPPLLAKAWGLLFLIRQSLRHAVTKTLTLVITSEQ